MEYATGDRVTNNEHLAEAIDVSREGSAQPGSTKYDEPNRVGGGYSLRDSTFHVVIEELEKIDNAPPESQAEIDEVLSLLRSNQHADDERRAQAMAEAHDRLQDVYVPPE